MLPDHWFEKQWPHTWEDIDITVKELVPIVVAAALWGRNWHNLHVRFHSDNMPIVLILQNHSASNLTAHYLLRCFYFYTAYYQFDYSIEHVSGIRKLAADALSRDNLSRLNFLILVRRQSLKIHNNNVHFVIKATNLLYMLLNVLQKDLDIGPLHNFNPWS